MILIKALIAANKSERDKFTIPRSVQQSIPVKCIYEDGTWQIGRKHSRTWRFTDVNYAAASEDDQRGIFLSYGGVLNSLPTDAAAKVTIINRRLNPVTFQRTMLMKERGDGLDKYRQEANSILTQRAAESNNLVQEKYITLSIPQRKIEESRAYFRRVDATLSKSFGRLDSGARSVSNHDRLRILHDFFRPGEEQYFTFDQTAAIRRGLDFKDLICPDGMHFRAGYFEMGDKVGRVLFLKDYASYIKDSMAEFTAHIANLGKYNAGVLADTTLSFPATTGQVQEALRKIGVDGLRYEEIIVLEYSIGVKGVARALGEYTHIDELNYLASRLEGLDPEDMGKFIAAVEHGEYAGSAEQLINLTYNLEHYELYPVWTPEEYGLWLVDELAAMELPEQARDYFDFEAYGEATAINEGGTFTSRGYMLAGPDPFQKVYDGQHVPEQYKVFQYPVQQKIAVPRSHRSRDSPKRKRP